MATKQSAAKEAAERAAKAVAAKKQAEKKKIEHTYTAVGQQSTNQEELIGAMKKNALPYRIIAVICWLLAIGCEVMAILLFTHRVEFSFTMEDPGFTISWIAALVLDLAFLIVGSQMWKKGNHLSPAKKANALKFWLQNNLGVIVAALAFAPFIIFALLDKNASKQSKIIAVVAAAVALAVGGLASYDWNPISQEEVLEEAGVDTVYWTKSGTVFHAYDDCQHLNRTVELMTGTSTTAIENGKTRLCKTCEARAAQEAAIPSDEQSEKINAPGDEPGQLIETDDYEGGEPVLLE